MAYDSAKLKTITSGYAEYTINASETLAVLLGAAYFSGVTAGTVIRITDGAIDAASLPASGFVLVVDAAGTATIVGSGSIAIADTLQGANDSDTTIVMGGSGGDSIVASAGGVEFFRIVEDTQDALTFNNGAVDIDFTINKLTSGTALNYNAGADTLSLGAANNTIAGGVVFADGTTDVDIASHDGTNGLKLGGTLITASAAEINRVADVSGRIVNCTSSTLTVTEALHDGKTIVLDRAAGIAVTLPAAAAGLRFRFIVKTTFTGAASIKSVSGADIMIGEATMGNDSDNTTVRWPATAADTYDTIDMLGTSNSTGGLAGQIIEIEGLATNLWFVRINGDAAGMEATPFADTVA